MPTLCSEIKTRIWWLVYSYSVTRNQNKLSLTNLVFFYYSIQFLCSVTAANDFIFDRFRNTRSGVIKHFPGGTLAACILNSPIIKLIFASLVNGIIICKQAGSLITKIIILWKSQTMIRRQQNYVFTFRLVYLSLKFLLKTDFLTHPSNNSAGKNWTRARQH